MSALTLSRRYVGHVGLLSWFALLTSSLIFQAIWSLLHHSLVVNDQFRNEGVAQTFSWSGSLLGIQDKHELKELLESQVVCALFLSFEDVLYSMKMRIRFSCIRLRTAYRSRFEQILSSLRHEASSSGGLCARSAPTRDSDWKLLWMVISFCLPCVSAVGQRPSPSWLGAQGFHEWKRTSHPCTAQQECKP